MKKFLFLSIAIFFFGSIFGQNIEKTWQFAKTDDSIQNSLTLKDGAFHFGKQEDSLVEKKWRLSFSEPSFGTFLQHSARFH